MTNEIIDFLILSLHQKMVNDLFDEAWNNSHIASFEVEDTELKLFKEAKKQKKIKDYKAAIKELELLKDFNRE